MSTLSDSFLLPVLAWMGFACIIWLLSIVFSHKKITLRQTRKMPRKMQTARNVYSTH